METAADRAAKQLEDLGFSQYEARAYCALVRQSPLNGHEVSRASGIPPAKIYETLHRLVAKGAVLHYQSDPALYAPVPHRDLLARLRHRTEATLDAADAELAALAREPTSGLTWSLMGGANILAAMVRAAARAERRIFAALWEGELDALAAPLEEAYHRGVELHVAVYGAVTLPVPHTYDLTLCGASAVERLGGRRLAVFVRDEWETVLGEFTGSGQEAGIWTENAVMSLLAVEYIREDIMGRVLINELGEERYQRLRRRNPTLVAMLRRETAGDASAGETP